MKLIDAKLITLAAAGWVGVAGFVWGSGSAGGADPYGYVSQADLWASGDLIIEQPVAERLPWPNVDATLSPLGYRPGPTSGTIVPIYPTGLPIVMGVFQWVAGREAVFWVVPLLGIVTVAGAAALGYRLAGPTAAAFAALLLGMSPTLLYSVMWPMSDVAAAGWWALSLAFVTGAGRRSAVIGGLATALAVLTRPNLVLVSLVPWLYVLVRALRQKAREDFVRLALFSALTAAGFVAVAAIHTVLYGSPLESGYGDLGTFFETSRRPYNPDGLLIRPLLNARAFILRPLSVEPALLVCAMLGVVATFLMPASADVRAARWLSLGVVCTVLGSYLFFRTNREWWFLRLLLPAYPAAAALAGLGVAWVSGRLWEPLRLALLGYLIIIGGWYGVKLSLDREIQYIWVNESRYEEVGRFVDTELPQNAALFARQHSGSLRYYCDCLTVRFDRLSEDWLEPATEALREAGYTPYFVVEDMEETRFVERFESSTPLGALDWPPLAEFYGANSVRIYDPDDRQRHRDGEQLVTREIASRYAGDPGRSGGPAR